MPDTARPTALPVSIAAIPEALRAIPQWLVWEYARRQGQWTKIPYRAGLSRLQPRLSIAPRPEAPSRRPSPGMAGAMARAWASC
jgi:hypothetical protein